MSFEADRKGQRHPTLIVSFDQCGTSACLLWYMQFQMRGHFFVATELFAPAWERLSTSSDGHAVVAHICLAASWEATQLFRDMRQVAQEHTSFATIQEPRLVAIGASMLRERDEADGACEANIAHRSIEQVREPLCWSRLGMRRA